MAIVTIHEVHICTVVASHPVDRAVPAVVGDVAGGVPLASRVGERVGVEGGRSRRSRLAAAVARVVLIDLGNVLVSIQWPWLQTGMKIKN